MRGLFEGAVYSEGANYSRKYGMVLYRNVFRIRSHNAVTVVIDSTVHLRYIILYVLYNIQYVIP